jgi:hypothetical protein
MQPAPRDLAQVRLDNALALFEEFVRATARHADAATLRGLERRFAERVQIQPSYWSQIKGRSRQIGERLARQFEQLCHKPAGWMDQPRGTAAGANAAQRMPDAADTPAAPQAADAASESLPHDDDERFIVGLVLTYYRRHPQRARARLLDLLGEVLIPGAPAPPSPHAPKLPVPPLPPMQPGHPTAPRAGTRAAPAAPTAADEAHALWLRTQASVAPLKRKK